MVQHEIKCVNVAQPKRGGRRPGAGRKPDPAEIRRAKGLRKWLNKFELRAVALAEIAAARPPACGGIGDGDLQQLAAAAASLLDRARAIGRVKLF